MEKRITANRPLYLKTNQGCDHLFFEAGGGRRRNPVGG